MATSGGRVRDTVASEEFFAFSADTGHIVFRGKKIGSMQVIDGATKVAFNIQYESDDENWILPLSWLAHGLRQARLDYRPEIVLDVAFESDDAELAANAGSQQLIEKTFKVAGRSWRFHKSDADHWPSPLHGHDYEHGQVIDGVTGEIFDKATRTQLGRLKPNKLMVMHDLLRASKDLAPLAAQHLPSL